MASVELASAYISLIPSTKGMGKAISKQFGVIETEASKAGRSAGERMTSAIGGALKKVGKATAIGAGVAVGAALVSGFRSALDQQNIQATVAGLYQDAGKAFSTLQDIRELSSGSPIDYSAYGKAAQSLAYAGVQGDQAVTVLDKVGWAIVGAGGGATELDRAMTGLLKGVNNGGIVMNDTLAMISESGYPIIDGLSEKFGTTGDVIKKMAADGEISVDDVLSVMENGTGELARSQAAAGKEVAKTFGSQWKIAKDNVATAIGDTMLPAIEKIAPAMKPISDAIVSGIEALPGIFEDVKSGAQDVIGVLRDWSPMIFGIVGAIAAWNVVQAISNTLSWAAYLWQSRYVLMGAARIAITNGMALAQRGLNAAMRANPIGLIITAIMLLVGAFVTAYNNVDWFRNMVDVAWAWIKNAIDVVVQWFVNTAWPWMQQAIQTLGDWFTMLYQDYIKPAWDAIWGAIQAAWGFIQPIFDFIVNAIKTYLIIYFQLLWTVIQIVWKSIQIAIQFAWNNIIKPIWDAIVSFIVNSLVPWFNSFMDTVKTVWSAIETAINWAWKNIIKPIWDAIVAFLRDTLAPRFNSFKDTVESAWDNIKSAISTVWNFIRDNVFDPLENAIKNTLPDAFETGKDAIGEAWEKLKDVAKAPVKFVIETVINDGIIGNFNKIADIFDVDPIDKVSLPSGFAGGGWTGAGSKYKPAGIVHADEFVVQKSSRRRIEKQVPGALDYMNKTGRFPDLGGYASGGRVGTLWDAAQWWIQKGARAGRHSWFNGGRRITSGHSNGSMHYSDQAVDFNYGPGGQNATEMAFFDRWIGQFQTLFPGIRTIWRAPGHYDHLHIDTKNGANMGGDGGGGFSLDFLTKPFTDLKEKITEGIPGDGWFSDIIRGGANTAIGWPVEWITDNIARVGEMVHNAGDAVGSRAVKESVRQVAMLHGWGFGSEWNALDELIRRESTWNPAAANPTTTARGLFQKMTSIHGPLESTTYGQAQWGLDYIKGRYGSPSAALRFHDRNNYYSGGGLVKPTLYDKGGVLEPGTSLVSNKTRKPEYILPAKVTDALMGGTTERGGDVWNIYGPDPMQTAYEVDRMQRKRELLSVGRIR